MAPRLLLTLEDPSASRPRLYWACPDEVEEQLRGALEIRKMEKEAKQRRVLMDKHTETEDLGWALRSTECLLRSREKCEVCGVMGFPEESCDTYSTLLSLGIEHLRSHEKSARTMLPITRNAVRLAVHLRRSFSERRSTLQPLAEVQSDG